MSPRNYFFQSQNNPYFQSHEYKQSKEYRFEQKAERLFGRIWRGIKKILWPF